MTTEKDPKSPDSEEIDKDSLTASMKIEVARLKDILGDPYGSVKIDEIDKDSLAALIRLEASEIRDILEDPDGVQAEMLKALEVRFSKEPVHYKRPEGINFVEVKAALEANPFLIDSLISMEASGGEPDIIIVEEDAFIFAQCSPEPPENRGAKRVNYYEAAQIAKEFRVDIMPDDIYHRLQDLGRFDMEKGVWLKTHDDDLQAGEALCGRRFTKKVKFRIPGNYDARPEDHPMAYRSLDGGDWLYKYYEAANGRWPISRFRAVLKVPKV